ncbi:MAG: hypothetical protein DMG62_12470 [Acidobacteria bacterium]|nr:MAG: hypothetical protein DMG62_12470 [Acidobacteriota bacterium]
MDFARLSGGKDRRYPICQRLAGSRFLETGGNGLGNLNFPILAFPPYDLAWNFNFARLWATRPLFQCF